MALRASLPRPRTRRAPRETDLAALNVKSKNGTVFLTLARSRSRISGISSGVRTRQARRPSRPPRRLSGRPVSRRPACSAACPCRVPSGPSGPSSWWYRFRITAASTSPARPRPGAPDPSTARRLAVLTGAGQVVIHGAGADRIGQIADVVSGVEGEVAAHVLPLVILVFCLNDLDCPDQDHLLDACV